MLRLQPQALTAHQQGACLSVLYCHSPEVSFMPLCFNAIRRTLLCFSSQLNLLAIKANHRAQFAGKGALYPYSVFIGSRASYLDLINRLRRLMVRVKQKTSCYVLKLKSIGPTVVVSGHLLVPPTIELLAPNKYLTSLSANYGLNISMIFSSYSVAFKSIFRRDKLTLHEKVDAKLTAHSSLKCLSYAYRLGHILDNHAQEITLFELLGPGTYAPFGIILNSFLMLSHQFRQIARVVLD